MLRLNLKNKKNTCFFYGVKIGVCIHFNKSKLNDQHFLGDKRSINPKKRAPEKKFKQLQE